jgi:hypothetical protein
MPTRYFALLCGVVFTTVGVLGFIPAFSPPAGPEAPELAVPANYGYLLSLFPVNLLHNLIHLAIGVLGFATWRSYTAARTFARGLAIYLGLLTLMGLVPVLYTTFGLVPLYGNDVWLHGLEALLAAYFGFVSQGTQGTQGT